MIKIFYLIFILFWSYVQINGQDSIALKLKSSMIWDATAVLPDSVPYRHSFPVSSGFRKQLFLSEIPESVNLYIFADARYMLWINGVYVNRGPNRFDPKRVEYDTHSISNRLRKGKNSIAILVQSGLSNYRFIYHKPGLGVVVETKDDKGTHELFATDSTCLLYTSEAETV